ncbi:MAG: hypothetical protein GY781_10805 [Gammaproteobacteria bacterium]|nr:hypothetical protein [Gammaproteobacteria bacterium]
MLIKHRARLYIQQVSAAGTAAAKPLECVYGVLQNIASCPGLIAQIQTKYNPALITIDNGHKKCPAFLPGIFISEKDY